MSIGQDATGASTRPGLLSGAATPSSQQGAASPHASQSEPTSPPVSFRGCSEGKVLFGLEEKLSLVDKFLNDLTTDTVHYCAGSVFIMSNHEFTLSFSSFRPGLIFFVEEKEY